LTSVWVIVRVDLYHLRDGRVLSEPHLFVTVKEVLDTEEKAQAEVARLNDLHPDRAVVYFYEQGRSLRPETEADER
jgi:hypothetical protein